MRRLALAALALAAAGLATLASTGPVMAYDYPWCIRAAELEPASDCSYRSYAQCMASASGRYASCYINPRVAYGRAYRGEPYYGYAPRQRYRYGEY